MTTNSDVYQLGIIVYLVATGKHWHATDDPAGLCLPQGYDYIGRLLDAIVWCLQIDPKRRLECDLDNGLLFTVDCLRQTRNAMFARDGPPDETIWNKWQDPGTRRS